MKKLALGQALAIVISIIIGAGTAFGGIYPSPPPNFAHPGQPHASQFNPTGGSVGRPVLVVYAQFTDFPFPQNMDAAFMARRMFTQFPNVAGYFNTNSFGKLVLTPAAETDTTAGGAVNDGIVAVSINMTHAAFETQTKTAAEQNKQIVQAADAAVNFAAFDANNDGKITTSELGILVVKALPANVTGANFPINQLTLDGKSIALSQVPLIGLGANVITLAHELGHQLLDAYDLYDYGVGQLDLYGPTYPLADDTVFGFNAWQKMHLGWITPTVVTQDGYYDVQRADTTGNAYILYDPMRGTDYYFMVENRQPTPGTYDKNATDRGLVIWRVDDSQWGNLTVRAIEVMRPDGSTNGACVNNQCYGGKNGDAWDPSDAQTLQRTMDRKWPDLSDAKVAVRAIGDAGPTVRAYFDVRGPGVLVDTYDRVKSGPVFIVKAETEPITFPVMNTGELADTFAFTINVPAGWTATTDTQTLGAGAKSTATIKVTPPLTAATGQSTLNAVGVSVNDSSITSSSPVGVWVLRRPTTIVYAGDLSADYHDAAALSATLTDTLSGVPLAGKSIDFELGNQLVGAVTSNAGVGSTSLVMTQAPGNVQLQAFFLGDSDYGPSVDQETFTITREETTTTYIGPTVILQGASGVTLKAQLLEDGTTAPSPSGQSITLSLGGQSCTGAADGSGVASCQLQFTGALGPQPIKAEFAGDTYYEPSADTGKTAIVFAFPTSGAFLLGDDTVAAATPATTVTWWDSRWSSLAELSTGDSPPAFKGYADSVVSLPTTTPPASCGGTWSTRGGNSAPPSADVPSYMGVLVTPSVGKTGSRITGSFSGIVVVATDPGYEGSPGHSGTGRIIATFCP